MTGGRQIFLDRLYVILLCAVLSALAWMWQFDSPPPDLMDGLAAAAGLRPPPAQLSLLWQHVAGPLCRAFGLPAACTVLRVLGHVSLGLFAFLATALYWMMLPASLLRGGHVASWWRVAVRFVLFQGTALLCFSDPVWNAFRWFSPLSLQVLIAAAGGAAHLAGAVAARTLLPVIGIPVEGGALNGLDALLATVQMPGGIPVATVGIGSGGATNAGLLAAQIIATGDAEVLAKLQADREKRRQKVLAADEELQGK